MKRYLPQLTLLLLLSGSHGYAQAPTPPNSAPNSHGDFAPAASGEAQNAGPVRRQLAAPLRNQYDPYRPRLEYEELKTDEVTPEMWLYMQEMRRYDDPVLAVRRNAADRAAHRRARIAAMQWFGFSNSRPQAAPVPFLDVYSPGWVSNSWNPYAWIGSGHAWSAVRVEPVVITR